MESTLTSLALVILLLAINGFFVAAEFALVKSKGIRIDHLASRGNRSAQLTRKILENLESYLAACQLGITMASLGLGWVGEPAVSALLEPLFHGWGMSDDVLHTSSFIIGFLLFSSLHIVVGEQVPKTFAIRKPEPVSLWVAYPLWVFFVLVWPLNRLLSLSTSSILRCFGVAEVSHIDVMTGEELRDMIDVSEQHGQLARGNAEMLHNLFDFGERTVKEVMVPRTEVEMIDLQKSPQENMALVLSTAHSRFPVFDGNTDRLLGMILTKDLFNATLAGNANPWEHIRDFLREPLVAPETQLVSRLFQEMRSQQAHMALVVDEYGTFVGLLTMEDLLEEIVGEIADETDESESEYPIIQLSEYLWKAHGLASLTALEKALDIELPDNSDANTLSGLFMNTLREIPWVGATIICCSYRMTVLEIEGHRVETATLEKIADDQDAVNAIAGD
jgi:CBS domain containing-hemolysin-like protein